MPVLRAELRAKHQFRLMVSECLLVLISRSIASWKAKNVPGRKKCAGGVQLSVMIITADWGFS